MLKERYSSKGMLTSETHFVYAAPKSMTIAVFSPPLPNPSNKGILLICSPLGDNKVNT